MGEKTEAVIAKVDGRTLCVWLSKKSVQTSYYGAVEFVAFVYAQPVTGGDTVVLARERSSRGIDAAKMMDRALETLRAAGAEIHGPDYLIPWLREL